METKLKAERLFYKAKFMCMFYWYESSRIDDDVRAFRWELLARRVEDKYLLEKEK